MDNSGVLNSPSNCLSWGLKVAVTILDREITRVAVIDDDKDSRDVYTFTVQDSSLEPVDQVGPLPELDRFEETLRQVAQSALCDHHLSIHNYASFNGAELVARCYDARFPAVLCTDWETAHIDEIRAYRSRIPVLLKPADLNSDTLIAGLSFCISEWTQGPQPTRRPWRTQVHVQEVENEGANSMVYVEIPGWSSEVIRLRLRDIPDPVRSKFVSDYRCHANVNIGAETADEIFFADWEDN